MITASILICGAGIVGLTVARDLVAAGYDDILIIDKEPEAGRHASGRNSGVLHAGIYYAPGSLRAQSCLQGNLRMKQYCEERGLPLLKTGKVIVARDESELPTLRELYTRATQNGAKVDLIDDAQLAEIEPNAKSAGQALFSHYTAVVDPKAILKSIQQELLDSGKVRLVFGTRFLGRGRPEGQRLLVRTTAGDISCAFFLNAAGAYGDVVAHAFGLMMAGHDKTSALAAIEAFLHTEARAGRRCLLVVDESQHLSVEALEELRMLSNFQLGSHPLLQILLLGQPEFRDLLQNSPRLEQLRQRVIDECLVAYLGDDRDAEPEDFGGLLQLEWTMGAGPSRQKVTDRIGYGF